MKTIEEAADIYALPPWDASYNGLRNAFIACVAFAQQWISVDDELPDIGKCVLLNNSENQYTTGYYCAGEFRTDFDKKELLVPISHWRPIELK